MSREKESVRDICFRFLSAIIDVLNAICTWLCNSGGRNGALPSTSTAGNAISGASAVPTEDFLLAADFGPPSRGPVPPSCSSPEDETCVPPLYEIKDPPSHGQVAPPRHTQDASSASQTPPHYSQEPPRATTLQPGYGWAAPVYRRCQGTGRPFQGRWYAVARGREPGIYPSYGECVKQVNGFKGSAYQSFLTYEDAEDFVHHCG